MNIMDLMLPHLRTVKPYVPGKPIEELRRETNFQGEIVKLASNENPYDPIDEVREAIISELAEVNRYPNSGSYYLCAGLSEYYHISADRIFVGNGSNEIIDLLARAFVGPKNDIVYAWPSFIVYPIVSQLMGVRAIEVPLRDYRLDMTALREAVTPHTRMVFICNPNNPTGTYVSRAEVERFLDGLREDIFVVFDEAYFEYVVADDFPDTLGILARRPTTVILRTFSKIHSLSGLRVGYSLSHEDVVTCLHKVRQPFNVNRLAQAAALAALTHMDKLAARVSENRTELQYVREELQKLGFTVPPSQTNFLLAVPPHGAGSLVERLMGRGIIVRPMKPFGFGDEAFRVTIGTPYENRKFLASLREIM